ncbi:hypothetical protein B0T18DRAFT_479108 [Schizothecium vesticola]|uniref:Uncharacterized protein n=1 Tax=Schizothecium vesticola TaxID=314040 RepID=A0AA40KBH3_9PEZI|nr:hypothetical protein B0T18DRAFT_479108 [Schizothecium vesticola]
MSSSSSHKLPEVLMAKLDAYVDSLAPQIQPRIAAEIETFQHKTLDSLEEQIVSAFRSLFNKDSAPSGSRGLSDNVPDAYGAQSLPFADEIAKLTRSVTDLADGASDDLRDIFDLTEGPQATSQNNTRSRGGPSGGNDSFKSFFSAAANIVQDRLEKNTGGPGGQRFELDGLLGVLSNTVKDAARNPEEKARIITPDIREALGAQMTKQHAPIAEQFTRVALSHIKRWLRGNTSSRDIGDGVKGEIEDHVKDLVKGLGGLFGSKKHHSDEGSSRGIHGGDRAAGDGESGGFSKLISEKLSTGLAKVHRDVRLDFRKTLGQIERELFEMLPDQFQRPLEKILGGNPFDAQLDRDAGVSTDRGFGDDVKTKLLGKIRGLIKKVQETLRESILGTVNGGHRKFERESWVFVQNIVEQKIQKYLPKVKINVPDDIGNEGVSVGAPTSNVQLGGGHQSVTPTSQQPLHVPSHQQDYTPGSHQPAHQQSSEQYTPYTPQQHILQQYNPQQYAGQPSHQPGQPQDPRPDQGHQQDHQNRPY